MKNIHLLPTNKPSRIAITDTDVLGMYKVEQIAKYGVNQNIYITSDEEIKEGEYTYSIRSGKVEVSTNSRWYNQYSKKIILTTDQDLIKDGVQALGDEFLEWFVKNPNCMIEEVEIGEQYQYHSSKEFYGNLANYVNCSKEQYDSIKETIPTCPLRMLYKITIPNKEPNFSNSMGQTLTTISLANSMFGSEKTHYMDELPNMDKNVLEKMWDAVIPKLEPKNRQIGAAGWVAEKIMDDEIKRMSQTDAAKNYVKDKWEQAHEENMESFIEGAKWQEKMNMERLNKEAIEFVEWVDKMGYTQVGSNYIWKSLNDEKAKTTPELFIQFKNK